MNKSVSKNSTNVRALESDWRVRGARLTFQVLGKAAPRLASWWAERLFLSARRFPRPAWEQEILAGAEVLAIESPWGALPAWSWGAGPTVLLVHGWEGRGSQLGRLVGPLVARGLRVVTFDAPGHGDGPRVPTSIVDLSRAIRHVARHLGPLHGLVAHSVGGAATTLALAEEALAERLVFLAPPHSALRYTQGFAQLFGMDEPVREGLVRRLQARYGLTLEDLDTLRIAPRMTAPLFIAHDEDDHEVPVAAGRALGAVWPGARLRVTRGLGHRRILREQGVIDEVVHFVAEGSEATPRSTRSSWGELEAELFFRERRWQSAPAPRVAS